MVRVPVFEGVHESCFKYTRNRVDRVSPNDDGWDGFVMFGEHAAYVDRSLQCLSRRGEFCLVACVYGYELSCGEL